MLDGATRIKDMVSRAVELGMPAVAITDPGYMYGVPELGLACDAVNHGTPEYKVWSHDKSVLEKGRRDELAGPDQESDPRGYEQHMKDLAMWDEKGNIDELKPPLVIKPIFGCEVYFTRASDAHVRPRRGARPVRPDAAPGRHVRAVAGFMWSLAAGRNSLGRGSAQPYTQRADHEPGAHMRSVRAHG